MNVVWDSISDLLYVKEKMSNGQTFYMEFSLYNFNAETNYWNIGVQVYSKRKHFDHNEDNKLITSKLPIESAMIALKAFKMLEQECIYHYAEYNNIIFCTWIDTRRRDIYYKYLSKRGYNYGNLFGFKCIMKKFNKN